MYKACYLNLSKENWHERVQIALEKLEKCDLCPHVCAVCRTQNQQGICKTGRKAIISSFGPHMGEEDCLRGKKGSGTIFFSRCNLLCVFCQNCDISHYGEGYEVTADNLAGIMLEIQNYGCHNLNLVTPGHVVPQILESLEIAVNNGLSIPIVYNTNGYDSLNTLKLLDGIVDIYMPDIKFLDPEICQKFTVARNYGEMVKIAVKEMHHQVGDLTISENGLATRGLLVRHLVMPDNVCNIREIMNFLVKDISPHTYVNLMSQYHPAGAAWGLAELRRAITREEFEDAYQQALEAGIHRFDSRPLRRFFW